MLAHAQATPVDGDDGDDDDVLVVTEAEFEAAYADPALCIWRSPPPDYVPISRTTLHQIDADFRAAINLKNETLIAISKERSCSVWWTQYDGPMMPIALAPDPDDRVQPHTPTLEEAEAAITETRTDDEGLPFAIPDDRVPLGDGDPLPERPPAPALLGLLYHDKVNYLAGDKSTGKTWIALEALAAAVKQLALRVVWLDAEDSAAKFSDCLARLGHRDLTTSAYVRRFNWSDWIDADELDRAAIAGWLAAGGNGGHLAPQHRSSSTAAQPPSPATRPTRSHGGKPATSSTLPSPSSSTSPKTRRPASAPPDHSAKAPPPAARCCS